jgi:hypothetical protein
MAGGSRKTANVKRERARESRGSQTLSDLCTLMLKIHY